MSRTFDGTMQTGEMISAVALYNTGKALKDQRRFLEAAEHFHQALSLDPTDADAAYMLANSLRELGSLEEALVAYESAIALRPNHPDLLTNKGVALRRLGRVHEAMQCYRAAIALSRDHAEAHWNLSLCLLLIGAEEEGWKEFEWRWSLPSFPNYGRVPTAPRWDGRIDRSATVLLRSEQGFGDTIQFARYVPLVAERCAHVVLECPPPLVRLLSTAPVGIEVIPAENPLPAHGFEFPLMSLPSLPGFQPARQAWTVPYLRADEESIRKWKPVLGERRGLRVGLIWGGRVGAGSDPERSVALDQLLPLSAVPGIEWVSLQQGAARAQRDGINWEMLDVGSALNDFADTAAVLSQLDLVISIDSAGAHLAGALGIPVWTLLPFAPDWRWLIGRSDSAWYPTMRLFRQPARGSWGPVVETVTAALRRWRPGSGGSRPSGHRHAPASPRAADLIVKGNRAFEAGAYTTAEELFRSATTADAGLPAAWFNLGNSLLHQNRHEEAIESYLRARALEPRHHAILHNLGVALTAVHRFDEAVQVLTEAVEHCPDSSEYLNSLGSAYAAAEEHDQAIACYRAALRLAPNAAHLHYNAGEELLKLGRVTEAILCYRRSVELDEGYLPAYHNLGYALLCDRRVDEAISAYERGLAIAPGDVELRWNLAQALLSRGEYQRGWKLYEERWQTAQFRERVRSFPYPLWDGSPPEGKTLLLYAEQGYGDMLQFIRYASVLASAGARVVVECPPQLARLFRSARGVSRVIAPGESAGPCDAVCSLMSLPALLGTTLETIPAPVPYVEVDVSLLEVWRSRVEGAANGLRVGVVWSGRVAQWNERQRRLSLLDLVPLADIPGISLYSLQMGEAAAELLADRSGLSMIDLTGEIRDFADTAALILNLDCVIGIDTAVVHLAGALGKPVWTMLPFAADWRWLLDRDDSPWYPTMSLIRQEGRGDWAPVVEEVCQRLRRVLRNERAIAPAPLTLPGRGASMVDEATRQHQQGDLQAALAGYMRALEAGVESPVLFTNIGLLLAQVGQNEEGARWLERAIELDPGSVAALNGLGMYLLGKDLPKEARGFFHRGLRFAPRSPAILNNVGITLAQSQDTAGELSWFRAALRADASLVDAHWNLAQASLAAGLMEEGWREYEWRWNKPDFTSPKPDLRRPAWDGSPLKGKSILIHAEQGLGDTFQFCRYLKHPSLAEGRVVFLVQPAVLSVMRETFSRVTVVPWGGSIPSTDLQIPLMSLPRIFATTLENIPGDCPYLTVPTMARERWSGKVVRPRGGLAAGLVWHGSPGHRQDRSRSLPLEVLEELLTMDGIAWYSLQLGEAAGELQRSTVARRVVSDLSGELRDFADTAAVLLGLDLIISVDTAVAHLAGALGRTVWVMLPTPSDWRWMRGRTDSPWYPSMELFRQELPGSWDAPVRGVVAKLRERASGLTGNRRGA